MTRIIADQDQAQELFLTTDQRGQERIKKEQEWIKKVKSESSLLRIETAADAPSPMLYPC